MRSHAQRSLTLLPDGTNDSCCSSWVRGSPGSPSSFCSDSRGRRPRRAAARNTRALPATSASPWPASVWLLRRSAGMRRPVARQTRHWQRWASKATAGCLLSRRSSWVLPARAGRACRPPLGACCRAGRACRPPLGACCRAGRACRPPLGACCRAGRACRPPLGACCRAGRACRPPLGACCRAGRACRPPLGACHLRAEPRLNEVPARRSSRLVEGRRLAGTSLVTCPIPLAGAGVPGAPSDASPSS